MIPVRQVEALLRAEIVQVAGCTEPASVAYAFLRARQHLRGAFDPLSFKAELCGSSDVMRNASTAVVPFLKRRGLRTVVAAGLSSTADGFNLFPGVHRATVRKLLKRRSWLTVHPTRTKGVYVEAVLSTPAESVTVVIAGRHDEIRLIARNGKTLFRAALQPQRSLSMAEITAVVGRRDRRLEALARDFVVRQVRGKSSQALPQRIATLVRARMLGSPAPIMTITGSGNHGIFLGVPFYELYRKHGSRILPALVFTLLAEIHMTGKKSRISEECGLGTKAAPALAAGLAYARGADLGQITRLMQSVGQALRSLECHGARASCGGKAERAFRVVMAQVEAATRKPVSRRGAWR